MHPLDVLVERHRWIPATSLVIALAAGTTATYLYMFAYQHDDGRLSYQDLYSIAFVLTGVAFVAGLLGAVAAVARRKVAPMAMDTDRPPGLGEPSRIEGLATWTGIGMLVIALGFITFGVLSGGGESFGPVVLTAIGVGLTTGLLGVVLWVTAQQ